MAEHLFNNVVYLFLGEELVVLDGGEDYFVELAEAACGGVGVD